MTTETCPGCHGSGIEMSGVTYAGHSEYVGCHDCGPGCPSDCGCRVDAEPERPEFAVRAALGATQSQDGSPSATERLRGSEGAIGKAEVIDLGAVIADIERHREHTPRSDRSPARSCPTCEPETLPNASDVRSVSPARDAVTLDYDEASRVPALLADKAALMGERDRLRAERDRARGTAATLEAENARLTEALYLTRITLEATFRVLQEASGLPDDIDDPDCRDEMVLALRPRAEKAEAENARLVDRIERLSAEYEADLPESMAGDERLRRVFDDHANDVLGLLSDEDEGGE